MPKRKITQFNVGCGHRLMLAREAIGITQEQMAKKVHVGRTTIANYEAGSSKLDPEVISRLRPHFGIDVGWVFEGSTALLPGDLSDKVTEGLRGHPIPNVEAAIARAEVGAAPAKPRGRPKKIATVTKLTPARRAGG